MREGIRLAPFKISGFVCRKTSLEEDYKDYLSGLFCQKTSSEEDYKDYFS